MIYSVSGRIELKEPGRVVINASGVGYEILIPFSVYEALPSAGEEVKLLTIESVAMYGGGTTLYGFLTEEQKSIYSAIKEFVPSTGPKKALEYLDKASKSLPDFRRAIFENDPLSLVGIFGFTKKAAEKIIAGLKDRIDRIKITGTEKWAIKKISGVNGEAIEALVALGFRNSEAREMVGTSDTSLSVEQIIKDVLRNSGKQR